MIPDENRQHTSSRVDNEMEFSSISDQKAFESRRDVRFSIFLFQVYTNVFNI